MDDDSIDKRNSYETALLQTIDHWAQSIIPYFSDSFGFQMLSKS